MRKSIAATLLAASAATGACNRQHEDARATVSRNYQVGNFQEIVSEGPYDISVKTGANPSVSARGPERVVDNIAVEVNGDKLMVRTKDHGFFNWSWGSHERTILTVTVPQLRAATLAGSGDLSVNSVSGDSFAASLAGSGDLTVGTVNLKSLKLTLAGSGDAKIAGGQAQSADYNTVGAGDIDSGGVIAQELKISIAGSGDVGARATGTAEVSIMGSGDVTVTGGAKCSVSKMGSGDVHCS